MKKKIKIICFDIDNVIGNLDCLYSSRHFCSKNDFNYRISRYVRNEL